jgi:uncharacterized protein (DUF488 family)
LYAPSLSAIATILTIGHSTHELEAFVALLRGAGIEALADVRRYPSSRRMPWFNRGALERSLAEAGVVYEHIEQLGGRRSPLPDSPNGAWRVGQFRGYADHMATDEFERGLDRLLALAGERRAAAMCAEARWTSCHRRLLADALVARGHEVLHVGSRGAPERHELTGFARIVNGRVTYPPEQQSLAL